MKITELREGPDGVEEAEGWEMVDLWEEAGGSSAGEPVRDDVSTGGGGAGAATGTGGDAATRRGGANVEVRGGVLAMGCSGGEAVTRHGGVDEVTGRGCVDEVMRRQVREVEGRSDGRGGVLVTRSDGNEVARRDGREVEGRRGVVDLDFGGGRGAEEEEDWEDATDEWEVVEVRSARGAVPDQILRSVGKGMDIGADHATRRGGRGVERLGGVLVTGCSGGGQEADQGDAVLEAVQDEALPGAGGVGAATSSGSVRFENLDFGGEEEDWEEATEGWELVEASSARGSMPDEVLRGFAEGMDIGGGEVTAHARGGWADFAKTCLIAGAARMLFYPAVARNAVLDRYQAEFHWWDRIDESIILGAVPFRSQIPQLMELGVKGVVTLTEPFETLIRTSDYQANDMENLKIPTPDYYAAPSIDDICRALLFMNRHASRGHSTYIHCKAGRGRSTTVVLCYLIRFKHMTTEEAWKHTYSIRPRISLTRAQRDTVTQFGNLNRTGHLPMETDDTQEDMSSGGRNHME